MDRRTDIGNRLSGMGGNPPMPEGCMSCPYRQAIDNLKIAFQQPFFTTTPPCDIPTEPIAPPVPVIISEAPEIAEERLVDLPYFFVESLYTDIPRSNRLVRLLRGRIYEMVNDSQQDSLSWFHVHKVLEDRGLVYLNMKKNKIGEALSEILNGLKKGDTLRKQASKYLKGDLMSKKYYEWPENIFDRFLCKQVEKLLIGHAVLV